MAEVIAAIGLATSIATLIEVSGKLVIKAREFQQAVKNASQDMEKLEEELEKLQQVFRKLQDLAVGAEQSRRPLDEWPELAVLASESSPLPSCENTLAALVDDLTLKADDVKWGKLGKLEKRVQTKVDVAKWPKKKKEVQTKLDAIVKQKDHLIKMLIVDHM